MLVSSSNKILCRDTDDLSTEVWYDSLFAGGTTGPTGTNRLAAGTVIPASGFLDVKSQLFDQPSRWRPISEANYVAHGGYATNFLHYAVVELLFCTMLVAQEPGGTFHLLKHFYWNLIWELTFKRILGGRDYVPDRLIRMQQNLQRPARSGNPHDTKFFGKEYDLTLPVSNTVSNQAPRKVSVGDWGQG